MRKQKYVIEVETDSWYSSPSAAELFTIMLKTYEKRTTVNQIVSLKVKKVRPYQKRNR